MTNLTWVWQCFLNELFTIHLSTNPSIYPSINASIHLSIHLSIHSSIHSSINPSIRLLIYFDLIPVHWNTKNNHNNIICNKLFIYSMISFIIWRCKNTICDQKGTFSWKIMIIKCLPSIAHHSAILYRNSMNIGIQEGDIISLLDTKFHWIPVQNGGMTSDGR